MTVVATTTPTQTAAPDATDAYHITRISDGGVYGHATSACDEGGCAGSEVYLRGVDPEAVEVGRVYEIVE